MRFGRFPNIAMRSGIIAHALSRHGKGWFKQRLGLNVEIQWFIHTLRLRLMESLEFSRFEKMQKLEALSV
jgi:NitT/TauT family transport system substrate-binding protein